MLQALRISCAIGILMTLFSCATQKGDSIRELTQSGTQEPQFQQLKTEGRLLGLERKFFQAIEKLDQAATLKPDDAHVHLMLGEAYYHVGNGKDSLTHLEKSRELDPNNYQIESWLGTINIELGHLQEAEIAYANVLAIKPNDYNALVYMGFISFQKKDYRTCQVYFQRYKRLVDVIEPARLTQREKLRYQQSIEYLQACEAIQHNNMLEAKKSL